MSVKYVCENLNEFQKFGVISEKQDPKLKKDKEVQKSEEKEGLSVIKKIESNFKKFISSTSGKILKYKEFWSDNKKTAESFDDSGNIYKMYDSEYVVGVLMLPDEALSVDNLDTEIDLIDRKREKEGKNDEDEKDDEKDEDVEDSEDEDAEDEDAEEEETEEKEEEDADKNEWVRPRGTKFLLEKDELSLDFEKDEKKGKPKKEEPKLGFDFGDKDIEKDSNDSLDLGGGSDDLNFNDKGENHEYFVVYNISGDERDEIFRTDNVKVIKSFKDFYENIFKSTIREQIQKFKAEKEEKKLEQQRKAEEELKNQRKSKFDKFMKESVNDEDSYENLKKKYPNWNWGEAEEMADDDLDAAAGYFDRIANKDLDEAGNHWDLYAQNLKKKYPSWKELDDDNDDESMEDDNENDEIT